MNTPFENIEAGWLKTTNISLTMSAAEEMVRLSKDCLLQVEIYKELTKVERAEQRDITAQAIRDNRKANEAIAALAEALEAKYGISA